MSNVKLELSRAEALVFFDWLARFNEEDHADMDESDQQVLFCLESQLESTLPECLSDDYRSLVEKAKIKIKIMIDGS